MSNFRTPEAERQLVFVEGREDVGEVVQAGQMVGSVYCFAVHFPKDGLCAYYAKDRLRMVSAAEG